MAAMGPRSAGIINLVRIARLACTGDGEGAASALLATLRLRRVLPPSFFGLLPVPTVAQPAVHPDLDVAV